MNRKVYPPNVWRTKLITLAFILAVAAPARQAIGYYKIIDLGALGGRESMAWSINDNFQIVGHADDSSGNTRATLFDTTGGGNNIDLGALGGKWSEAYSINNHSQIVGWAVDSSSGQARATLFDPTGGGKNIYLGTSGGWPSTALSINDLGQIAGWAYVTSTRQRAILFDSTGGGKNIDLGTLGGQHSMAYSINNYDQIVGGAKNRSNYNRAVLFDPTGNGQNIDLGTIGLSESNARSINNMGQIVGDAKIAIHLPDRTIITSHATLFDPSGGGKNIDLGTLGGWGSWAFSINDLGQIVGIAEDSSGNSRATLFDPIGSGNNIDLNTLIDSTLGWRLQYAYSINDYGWIVGRGINPASQYRAYLLIPEPATVLLFGLSSLAMLTQRKVLLKR